MPRRARHRPQALVIGGRGKMGRWFADFLASQGFRAHHRGSRRARCRATSGGRTGRQTDLAHDLIVVATPLRSPTVLRARRRRPRGVVFDLGSLKTPLRAALARAARRRRAGHVGAPDVRSGHGAAVRPPRDLHRPRRPGRSRRRARFSTRRWPTCRDGARRARPADRLRARAFARGEHRVLHRARGERRGGAAARAHVEHHIRRAARRREPRGGENPELYFEIQSLNAYGEDAVGLSRPRWIDSHRAVHERDAGRSWT